LGDSGIPEENKKNEAPSWRRIIANFVQTYADAQRTKNEKERAENRSANWTAWATVAIAILTAVTIGVGISQYIIFDRQLGVMQGQLTEMQAEQRPWIYSETPVFLKSIVQNIAGVWEISSSLSFRILGISQP